MSIRDQAGENPGRHYFDNWECGDVYKDLEKLETAIAMSNAEQNLQQLERMEALNYFASQRRQLFTDVQKFLLFPLGFSMLLSYTKKSTRARYLANVLSVSLDIYFWVIVVITPLCLLILKRISMPPPPEMPDELKGLDPEFMGFILSEWEDPSTSCKDYSLFLLEYWCSSIVGIASIGFLSIFTKFPENPAIKIWQYSAIALTRVGAVASLHQYSKQLYKLLRKDQPRPANLFPSVLQPIVKSMFLLVPLGLASDLSKIFLYMKRDSLVAFLASISLVMMGTSLRLANAQLKSCNYLQEPTVVNKLVYASAITAVWQRPLIRLSRRIKLLPRAVASNFDGNSRRLFMTSIFGICIFFAPLIGPVVHILAVTNLIRVVYTHDLSLSSGADLFKAMIDNEDFQKERIKWRYRLEWREPKRLLLSVKDLGQNLKYWFLEKGTVAKQLEQELLEMQEESIMEGNNIFQRMQESMKDNGTFSDRDTWKEASMKRVAKKHQADYDAKSFTDALGVAVQQVLGIGLGFNFDHMTELKDGEKPSLVRLQARAAKSAIKRVQELYDPSRLRREVDAISDPEKREATLKERRRDVQEEIDFLAKRLSDLIPTSFSPEFAKTTRNDILTERNAFVKASSHEYVLPQQSTTIKAMYDIANPGGGDKDNVHNSTSQRNEDSSGDELIEAFLEQQRQREQDKEDNNDDDTKMVFA